MRSGYDAGNLFQGAHRLHDDGQTIRIAGARGPAFLHGRSRPTLPKHLSPIYGNAAGEMKQIARAHALT
ncbi:MAG: hypothetical protein ACLSUW_03910 [Akkermansia sp.]